MDLLKRRKSSNWYYVEFDSNIDGDAVAEFRLEREGDGWIIYMGNEEEKRKFLLAMVQHNYSIEKFYPQEQTLEQFVKEVTRG